MEPNHSILILNWKQSLSITLSFPPPFISNILIFFLSQTNFNYYIYSDLYIIQKFMYIHFFTLAFPRNLLKNSTIQGT